MLIRAISVLCLLLILSMSVQAADRIVYNNVEKHDGYPFSSGTKVVVTADSLVQVISQNDSQSDHDLSYANGTGAAFSRTSSWDNGEDGRYFTMMSYEDTLYTLLQSSGADSVMLYKLYNGSYVTEDTLGAVFATLGFGYVATDGTNWVAITKSNSTQYYMDILTITSGRIGGNNWVLVDSVVSAVSTQHRVVAAPVQGGLVAYNIDINEAHLIEADGTTNEDAATGFLRDRKLISTPRATGGVTFYDLSFTPLDPEGQGDTVFMAIADATNNQVWAYTIVTDSSDGSVALADSAIVSAVGQKTNMADTAGMRTPTITMAGDGFFIFYRDWADTTDLTATRISYHVCTDRSDLTTIGSRITLDTDSATSTIGEIMAPQTALVHNDTDSLYLYTVWQRNDGLSSVIATYEPAEKPSATPPASGAWGRVPQIF